MQLTYDDIILDEGWGSAFKWFVLVSILFHVVGLYFVLAVLPELRWSSREIMPPAVEVKLISFKEAPPAPPMPAAAQPEIDPKAPEIQDLPEAPDVENFSDPIPVPPLDPKEPPKPELKKSETIPPKPEIKKTPPPPIKAEEKTPPKPEPKKVTPPKPEPKPVAKPKPKPKSKPKRKPGVNPDKKISSAIAKIREKKQAEERDEAIAQRVAALKSKYKNADGDTKNDPSLRGSSSGKEVNAKIRDYIILISNILRHNWQMPSEAMLGDTGNNKLLADYTVYITTQGKVTRSQFAKKSGVKPFDISIENAIRKSKFPPMPSEIPNGFSVRFQFTPRGVRSR